MSTNTGSQNQIFIGYDSREVRAYDVCKHSLRYSTLKVNKLFSEDIEEYNRDSRSLNSQGSLIIDTVSYFHNFCESNKNHFNNNWMGRISRGDESNCSYIK